MLFWLTGVVKFPKIELSQLRNIFPLAMIHVLGNVLTNVSLGHVAVSFTHTVKVRTRFCSGMRTHASLHAHVPPCAHACKAAPGNQAARPRRMTAPALARLSMYARVPHAPDHLSVSVPSCGTMQAAEPFFSVLFSALFLGDVPPLPVLLTLIPIVGGVVIASFTEATFNWIGFLSAIASNITFQSRNVLSKKLMISKVSGTHTHAHRCTHICGAV